MDHNREALAATAVLQQRLVDADHTAFCDTNWHDTTVHASRIFFIDRYSHHKVKAYGEGTGQQLAYQAVPSSALEGKAPQYFLEVLQHLEAKGVDAVPFSDVPKRLTGSHTTMKEWFAKQKQ